MNKPRNLCPLVALWDALLPKLLSAELRVTIE
jgi:hypothetical protein